MRDEIGRSQGASAADVVDPTSRLRNEAEKLSGQFRRIPMGRHAFSARMRKSAGRHEPNEFFNSLLERVTQFADQNHAGCHPHSLLGALADFRHAPAVSPHRAVR